MQIFKKLKLKKDKEKVIKFYLKKNQEKIAEKTCSEWSKIEQEAAEWEL